ncbi:MAG: MBL fold metallo-hydrolase [Parvularculaceae bacterium]|nr:MBL fold metallo-hydrolase [Parvularculaceae bacterium]
MASVADKAQKFRVIILGCGSSGGVPRFGGDDGAGNWGACDPGEPRNRRTRCSILVERADAGGDFSNRQSVTSVLVDTSPDMRSQLLAARCARLDAVLFTHDHADQSHGVDDLRVFALSQYKKMPVYINQETGGELLRRFDYCFRQKEESWYPPILDHIEMPPAGEPFNISGPSGDIPVTAFLQRHGGVDSLGFRFGDLAYSSDVVDLPEESFEILAGVKIWIVDALQLKPHGTHAHLAKTLEWIDRVKPERAVLTNLHVTMDYATVARITPDNVTPAHDGMVVEFSA